MVSESHIAEWDMIYDPDSSLRWIVWPQMGLRKQCHSNLLFIKFSIYYEVNARILQLWEAYMRHISEEFFG